MTRRTSKRCSESCETLSTYAAWCIQCVMSRGRDDAHQERTHEAEGRKLRRSVASEPVTDGNVRTTTQFGSHAQTQVRRRRKGKAMCEIQQGHRTTTARVGACIVRYSCLAFFKRRRRLTEVAGHRKVTWSMCQVRCECLELIYWT